MKKHLLMMLIVLKLSINLIEIKKAPILGAFFMF
ncbi:hypothetical protein J608_5524, partial [Acinetobacter baumannii 1288284]